MIDEKKLIEEIKECYTEEFLTEYGFDKLVEAQPKVGEWIPCSERLPDKSGYYLYYADSPHRGLKDGIGVSYFQHKAKEWKKIYTPCVIAWMPLPEPYRGDEE